MGPDLSLIREKAGGAAAMARSLAEMNVVISPQAISQWRRVPADRVLLIEQVTGIPRHEIRPDLYPAPPSSPSGAAPSVPSPPDGTAADAYAAASAATPSQSDEVTR